MSTTLRPMWVDTHPSSEQGTLLCTKWTKKVQSGKQLCWLIDARWWGPADSWFCRQQRAQGGGPLTHRGVQRHKASPSPASRKAILWLPVHPVRCLHYPFICQSGSLKTWLPEYSLRQNISGKQPDIVFFQSVSFQNFVHRSRGRCRHKDEDTHTPLSLYHPDSFLLMQEGLSSVSTHKRFFTGPRRPSCHL